MKPGFGVNMLRHAFVSDVTLKDMPFVDELKAVADQLGHHPKETILYKKRI
jgi:pterin-4a-carbinolamine dehydratase